VILPVTGCARRTDSGEVSSQVVEPEQNEDSPSFAAPQATPGPQAPPPAQRTPPSNRNPQAPLPVRGSQDVRVYNNSDDLFFGLHEHQLFSFDFTLGPLYDESGTRVHSREVYTLFSNFFHALNEEKDIEDFLHPDYRLFLLRSLRSVIKGGAEDSAAESAEAEDEESAEEPEKKQSSSSLLKSAIRNFRVGEFLFSENGDMAETEILLFGATGRARGKIIAEQKEEVWYISGITIDFEDIFVPSKATGGEVFDPGPSTGPAF
jgi:hypothetical protein